MSLDFAKYNNDREYPTQKQFLDPLIEEIDNTPLTKVDRDVKISCARDKAKSLYCEALAAWHEKDNELRKQFFKDAREELGYGEEVNEDGCQTIEALAWQNGHSSGYEEVYNHLEELSGMVLSLVDNECFKNWDRTDRR